MTLGFVADRHLLMAMALPGEEPKLISWHDNRYTVSEALVQFPYFGELQTKMAEQRESIVATGEEYGLDAFALHGGAGTHNPAELLSRLTYIMTNQNHFVGFYNYEAFFKPFVVKFFELLGGDVGLVHRWPVCDLAWIYKAFLLNIPAESIVALEQQAEIIGTKAKGGTNITALAKALDLNVPKGKSYAWSDLAKVAAVYSLVFAKT